MSRHRTGYLFKRGDTYYLEYMITGKRVKRALKDVAGNPITTLKDARTRQTELMGPLLVSNKEETLREITNQLNDVAEQRQSVEGAVQKSLEIDRAWDEYLASSKRPDTGAETLRQYSFQFGRFLQWVKKNHPEVVAVRHVTLMIAEAYVRDLKESGFSAGTFNKHRNLLSLVFRVLKEKTGLTSNPWEDITRRKETQQSRREFTAEELERIIHTAPADLRVLFALGIYTGMRLGDCCTLRWAEVDLLRGIIIRVPLKTIRGRAKPIHVPMHPQLTSMLHELHRSLKLRMIPEYVLPKTAGTYIQKRDIITDRIQRHFLNNGIDIHKKGTGYQIKRDKEGLPVKNSNGNVEVRYTGKRAIIEVGFHSFRHTFVSLCSEAKISPAVVQNLVGHSNPAMTRHYTHVGDLAASQ
ncbi:MAG: site-specific integrase, partial [Kiritimatiellae bacterium]|nr:site-specific integrase [Kiritimatiellia bacterium]